MSVSATTVDIIDGCDVIIDGYRSSKGFSQPQRDSIVSLHSVSRIPGICYDTHPTLRRNTVRDVLN